MKRLVASALTLGILAVLANSAFATGLHRGDCCEPCKPACVAPCPKPCPDPCDPCARPHLGKKLVGWLKGLTHRNKCCAPACDPCGGAVLSPGLQPSPGFYPAPGFQQGPGYQQAPAPGMHPAPMPQPEQEGVESAPSTRLIPIPSTMPTTLRTKKGFFSR